MFSPFDMEQHMAYLRSERIREAEEWRLARQALRPRRTPRVRPRLAVWLRALADRLDARPTPIRAVVR